MSARDTSSGGSTNPSPNESEANNAASRSTAPHRLPIGFVAVQSSFVPPTLPENVQEIMSAAQEVAVESQNAAGNAALANTQAALTVQNAGLAVQNAARLAAISGHTGLIIEPGNWPFQLQTGNLQVPVPALMVMGGSAALAIQNAALAVQNAARIAALANGNAPVADQTGLIIETGNLQVPLQGVTVTGRNFPTLIRMPPYQRGNISLTTSDGSTVHVMLRGTGSDIPIFGTGTDSNTAAGIEHPEEILEIFKFDCDSKIYDDPEQNKCRICLALFKSGEDVCFLPCAHLFHGPCICEWLKMNAVCPTCRTAIR